MLPLNAISKSLSGYIVFNENQDIEEFSGQINLILRNEEVRGPVLYLFLRASYF